jgi:hypothetical protein
MATRTKERPAQVQVIDATGELPTGKVPRNGKPVDTAAAVETEQPTERSGRVKINDEWLGMPKLEVTVEGLATTIEELAEAAKHLNALQALAGEPLAGKVRIRLSHVDLTVKLADAGRD